jgi:hypothetical protein
MEVCMNVWFYRFNNELAKRHRTAYEKSLTSEHAIRVHKGSYYYKGYEIDWERKELKTTSGDIEKWKNTQKIMSL